MNIDAEDIPGTVKVIDEKVKTVAHAVEKELAYIQQAIKIIVNALKKG